ncbi:MULTISPECIES: DUF6263 family protein [Niastella]|uniref:Uncharacterized protein n=1 Tax=Niastella soli TaxID=2821487 RepID=A0ABS3YSD3_9BACT|nr:DUF6263 family protein [Niastella soli]MBO9200795.1 hypothetical protein [Niastella soli]
MKPFTPHILFSGMLVLALSCNTGSKKHQQPVADKTDSTSKEVVQSETAEGDNPAYHLRLNLAKGSTYHYTVEYETNTGLEVAGKKINVLNQSEIGVTYVIDKDSAGNYLFQVKYDKIHIRTKTGDKETEYTVPNAEGTADPMEKMLAALKTANIVATVTPAGKVTSITGYQGLSDKMLAGLNTDVQSRKMAQAQLEKVIGEGILKKNIDQLFNLYPDAAIHVGDSWKTSATQKGEIPLDVQLTNKLKDIDDDIATIKSKGVVSSNKADANIMGQQVTSSLQGEQSGESEVEIKTGLLLSSKTKTDVQGTLQMMAQEIPVTIRSEVKVDRKK